MVVRRYVNLAFQGFNRSGGRLTSMNEPQKCGTDLRRLSLLRGPYAEFDIAEKGGIAQVFQKRRDPFGRGLTGTSLGQNPTYPRLGHFSVDSADQPADVRCQASGEDHDSQFSFFGCHNTPGDLDGCKTHSISPHGLANQLQMPQV